jgi:transposase
VASTNASAKTFLKSSTTPPGAFTVEGHIRGKWVCSDCQTLIQTPVPAEVIDKGMPTAGLLVQVLVAKYADHLPLYRRAAIFARACKLSTSILRNNASTAADSKPCPKLQFSLQNS